MDEPVINLCCIVSTPKFSAYNGYAINFEDIIC